MPPSISAYRQQKPREVTIHCRSTSESLSPKLLGRIVPGKLARWLDGSSFHGTFYDLFDIVLLASPRIVRPRRLTFDSATTRRLTLRPACRSSSTTTVTMPRAPLPRRSLSRHMDCVLRWLVLLCFQIRTQTCGACKMVRWWWMVRWRFGGLARLLQQNIV